MSYAAGLGEDACSWTRLVYVTIGTSVENHMNKERPVNQVTELLLISIKLCFVPKPQATSCSLVEVQEAGTSHARVSNVCTGRSARFILFFFFFADEMNQNRVLGQHMPNPRRKIKFLPFHVACAESPDRTDNKLEGFSRSAKP